MIVKKKIKYDNEKNKKDVVHSTMFAKYKQTIVAMEKEICQFRKFYLKSFLHDWLLCARNLADTFSNCDLIAVLHVSDAWPWPLTNFYTQTRDITTYKLCKFHFDIFKDYWGIAIIESIKNLIWLQWDEIVVLETVDMSKLLTRSFWFLENQFSDPICFHDPYVMLRPDPFCVLALPWALTMYCIQK